MVILQDRSIMGVLFLEGLRESPKSIRRDLKKINERKFL
jgi:hypothetical protein